MKKNRRRCAATSADESFTFLDEELIVAEILPRLHVKALFKFKCVSTRYNSIISDPNFAQKYLQRAYTSPESFASSGLVALMLYPFTDLSTCPDDFFDNVKDLTDTLHSYTQYYVHDQPSIYLSSVSPLYDDRHKILASSNGLILSQLYSDYVAQLYSDYEADGSVYTLFVSNPLTKQCVKLPASSFTNYFEEFGIATRCGHGAAFLTYKIVIIRRFFKNDGPHTAKTCAEIFSSDTGSWATWEVGNCPRGVMFLPSLLFSYKGILHWLDKEKSAIFTYNPFDSPDRLGRIPLPNGKYSYPSLIYSGEQETLKYCGICKCGSGVYMFSVWRLVDSDKGEWDILVVAPIPWNRDVICHPFVIDYDFTVINPRTGTRKLVNVFSEETVPEDFCIEEVSFYNPLIPIEMCPWSSPFYVKTS